MSPFARRREEGILKRCCFLGSERVRGTGRTCAYNATSTGPRWGKTTREYCFRALTTWKGSKHRVYTESGKRPVAAGCWLALFAGQWAIVDH